MNELWHDLPELPLPPVDTSLREEFSSFLEPMEPFQADQLPIYSKPFKHEESLVEVEKVIDYVPYELPTSEEIVPIQTNNADKATAFKCKGPNSPKKGTCLKCNKTVAHLRKHMLVHTKQKPYKCQECDHCCSQKSNLNRHIKSKHTNEFVICRECGQKLKRNDKLKNHMTKYHSSIL